MRPRRTEGFESGFLQQRVRRELRFRGGGDADGLPRNRQFESSFLQRGVLHEPDWLLRDRDRGGAAGAGQHYDSYGGVAGEPRESSWVSRLSSAT